MNERIERLLKFVQSNNIYHEATPVEYDPFDEHLPEPVFNAKRLSDFILGQEVYLPEDSELIGLIRFDGVGVPADIFPRSGHQFFWEAFRQYYCKPQDNLCIFEWQHSNPDLGKVVRNGLRSYYQEINASRQAHLCQNEHLNFLTALEMFIQAMEKRAEQYRRFCLEQARTAQNPQRAQVLRRMAANLAQVPMEPARSFEEAIQCVYICWQCLSDSLGRPDQFLYPLYKHDIDSGIITRDRAKELLQELFLTIHRYTRHGTNNDRRGAECHFVVGGYTIDHEDGFNELSELIVESMMELPVARPQVSLRWNSKTPFSVLKKMMDYERKDVWKRIAFANDEPRIKSLMEILGFAWKDAYDYIVVGCNEPAFQGGISLGGNDVNILRSITDMFSLYREEMLECTSFDQLYALWEKIFRLNMETALGWSNRFNLLRSRDCNVMSSLFLDGCIERAQSATRGGARLARSGMNFMGGTNLIDCLSVIKQFVYDEKRVSLEELAQALDADWQGYEPLRQEILHTGRFFGNNEPESNAMARRINQSLYDFAFGRREHFGNQIMFGNLTGYNVHYAVYGKLTAATPDGRMAGSPLTFGSGQIAGKDRDGVTSHLLSVAQWDPTGIMCANTIMNLTMDRETVENEESFDKFVHLVETYFRAGGLHLQLNYISREELLKAKENPEDYKSLRVRVSGYSDFFTKLDENHQDNVIARTSNKL